MKIPTAMMRVSSRTLAQSVSRRAARSCHLCFTLILCLFLGACSAQQEAMPSGDDGRLAARAQKVTIIRDDYGVPHIYAKTDADAVFGLLYAQAEDDFPRIERNYYWALGRLAEAEGEAALFSDLRARLYMSEEDAIAAYDEAPKWLQDLCDAFADGLNYYLATHPEVTPRVLQRFEPWMPMFFFEGSIGGDIEQIPLQGITAFYGGDDYRADLIDKAATETRLARSSEHDDREPRGSNGFAIAGQHTQSGNAMLLINPHTSFYFRGEVHVVSEEGLNAYGAVTWGQFFVYQGFNEHTGWMHTSTGVDFMDEFIEDVSDDNGVLKYRYGQEMRPVETQEVTLKYRDGQALKEKTFTTYRTHHGPITHTQDGKWVATRISWDPVNALKQSYIRSKQTGIEGFRQMMDIRRNSSNNTVYADSDGNIAYYHGNFVPRRDPRFDYSKPVNGSDPATDWRGTHSVDEIINIVNPANGWLQNCNSTPFTAAGEFSPRQEDYPRYMAPDAENFRGVHAQRVLQGISNLTLDGLLDIAYDSYLPAFEPLLTGLIEAFDESGAAYPQLAGPVDTLRNWDLRVTADSTAMSLAHFYGTHFLDQGIAPEDLSRMQRITYLGTDTSHAQRLRMLAETVAMMEADYGGWNTPWGDINRFQRLSGERLQAHDDTAPSLPVGLASGRWGALASYGAKRFSNTKNIYGYSGNSFVAVVEFGERLRAKSLLAGGQSGDPDSPHFNDQAQRYVDRDFKDVAFYREDVEARATRRYRPGQTGK